jgi:hypothetical protein
MECGHSPLVHLALTGGVWMKKVYTTTSKDAYARHPNLVVMHRVESLYYRHPWYWKIMSLIVLIREVTCTCAYIGYDRYWISVCLCLLERCPPGRGFHKAVSTIWFISGIVRAVFSTHGTSQSHICGSTRNSVSRWSWAGEHGKG